MTNQPSKNKDFLDNIDVSSINVPEACQSADEILKAIADNKEVYKKKLNSTFV